jgi:HEAT repeat protein/tetratricopeptide repeat protein/cytochrome c552/cytochrome c554/c'-like protein
MGLRPVWLAAAAGVGLGLAQAPVPVLPPEAAAAGYVGAARCAECHSAMTAKWRSGRHSKMLQPASAGSVVGDFARRRLELGGRRYSLRSEEGAFYVTESDLEHRERERRVDFTLGSRRIQHYLTTLDDGRIVVLAPSWDVGRQQWFHNMEIVDPEESNQTRVQVWNANCVGCHVSQQQKRYEPASRRYQTRWMDFGTSCEVCHGPGRDHGADSSGTVRPERLGAERSTMVCAQCHSLRDVTAPGYRAGDDYFDHFMPILEYAQKVDKDPAYWADGRPRRFSNDALGLWQSRCFLEGAATCITCHLDPHVPDVDRNPQLAPTNNGLCLSCHSSIGTRLAEHTRHRVDGPGSSCIECHMPRTVFSIKARIRDHTISVPAPENTVRFGIPNACNACHEDKNASWAVRALQAWGAPAASGQRLARRAEAFTAARKGEPAAEAALIALLARADEPPLVRANAAGYLRRFDSARARSALVSVLKAEHPLVKAVAALTLAEQKPVAAAAALTSALADRHRIVRVAAAFALMNAGITSLPGEDGERLEAAKRDYVARAGLLTDHAETQLNLGKFFFLDRRYDAAAGAFEQARNLQPDLPGGGYFLALARVGQGRVGEARTLLARLPASDPFAEAGRQLRAKLDAAR